MKWISVKLIDICEPKQWKNLPISELKNDGFPVYGANGIIGFYPKFNHEFPTIAITCRGATCGNLHITQPKSYITSNAMALDNVSSSIDLFFLFYALKKRGFRDVISGSAQPQITREGLSKIKLSIPENKADQIRIATLLSQAEDLIQQRKESLRLLDELLRGAFLEMFGDPVRNEKGWEMKQLQNIAKARLGKMLDKDKPKGTHLRKYLANFNVQWFKINFDTLSEMYFLDRELKELELKFGDLLICEGGEVGRTAIWKNEVSDIYFQKAIHRVRPDFNIVTSEYLAYFFWFTATKTKFKKIVGTSTISHLTGEKLDKIPIPIPPLNLQKEFSNIVKKAEILRGDYQASLEELENLYASLSQRAFKGELDLDFEVEVKDYFKGINILSRDEIVKVKGGKWADNFYDSENRLGVPDRLLYRETLSFSKRDEKPIEFKEELVFNEKSLLDILKKELNAPFTFEKIWEAVNKTAFTTPPQYDEVVNLLYRLLEGEKPFLSQSESPQKVIEFSINT